MGQTTSNIPHSYQSSHTQSSANSTILKPTHQHGTTEQTIITETKRTTEATMRMEHKNAACSDLPITLSQKTQTKTIPVQSTGTMFESQQLTSTATNTEKELTKTDSTQTPPQPPPKPIKVIDENATIETQSISKQMAYDYFINKMQSEIPQTNAITSDEANIKYIDSQKTPKSSTIVHQSKIADLEKSIDEIKPIKYPTEIETHETYDFGMLKPGTPPDFGYIPAETNELKYEKITDRIKKLEESHKDVKDVPSGGVRMFPVTQQTQPQPTQFTKNEQFTSETKEYSQSTTLEPIYRPQASPIHFDRDPSPRPSAEGIAMEKLWTPKQPHEPDAVDLPEAKPTDGLDFSKFHTIRNEFLEEKSFRKISSFSESDVDTKYESASESENVRRTSTKAAAKMFEEKIKEVEQSVQQEHDLRAPSLVKQTLPKPYAMKTTPHSPLDDIHLEPGSPPEVCYAPRLPYERKKSLVEAIEETEKNLEKEPAHVLPGSVRIMPPPIITRKETQEIPTTYSPVTLPPQKSVQPKITNIPVVPEKCIDLQEFPYSPAPIVPKQAKLPPPSTPSKFIKSEYIESDYETDYKKLYEIDSDDRKYRPIKAPTPTSQLKSMDMKTSAESPCQFEIPPIMNGEMRPKFTPQSQQSTQQHAKSITTQQQQHEIQKPKPIKVKPISGYMADTEESAYHKTSTITSTTEQRYESNSTNHNHQQQNREFYDSQINQVNVDPNQSINPPAKHYRHHIHKHDTKDESSGNFMKVRHNIMNDDVTFI